MPAENANTRPGFTFWLSIAWIAVVLLAAATAGWWKIPAFDLMDWDNLSAVPGTQNPNVVLQNAAESEINRYVYWLGTDTMGRDIVSRLAYGARIFRVRGFGLDPDISKQTFESLREICARQDASMQISACQWSGVDTITASMSSRATRSS